MRLLVIRGNFIVGFINLRCLFSINSEFNPSVQGLTLSYVNQQFKITATLRKLSVLIKKKKNVENNSKFSNYKFWKKFRVNHFQRVHGRQHFERTLMAKIRLPNVHLEAMLRIDAKDAVKFTLSTMAEKKCFELYFI